MASGRWVLPGLCNQTADFDNNFQIFELKTKIPSEMLDDILRNIFSTVWVCKNNMNTIFDESWADWYSACSPKTSAFGYLTIRSFLVSQRYWRGQDDPPPRNMMPPKVNLFLKSYYWKSKNYSYSKCIEILHFINFD